MRASQIIKILKLPRSHSLNADLEIRGISCNSKDVQKGFVFVAIKGARQDGNKFIDEALRRGARIIVTEATPRSLPSVSSRPPSAAKGVLLIQVKDVRLALAKLAAQYYREPSREIKVVGVTGTNGKTTVTYLLEAILKESGYSPAVIGTINYRFQGKVLSSRNTTPGPLELEAMLYNMLKKRIKYCIMEVSSHALDQKRINGVNFHSAIFTNLTQDHLDYHKTLENYFRAKRKLFSLLEAPSFAVINNDDRYAGRIKQATSAAYITYGIEKHSDVMAEDLKFTSRITEFILKYRDKRFRIKSKLLGKHNVYNLLAAVAWSVREGIEIPVVKSALDKFSSVPGRLEKIPFPGGFSVFVDYAHTEDALENILKTLRLFSKNKVIVVFGCGGERDRSKRPKMGEVVSRLADYAIITNDNPRCEDPEEIIRGIKGGIKRDNFCVIHDRYEAIKKSLSLACFGDIVLIAGKGHENYQILRDRTIHFDDRETVARCLKSLNY
ncbi:MAG: UDP-N-acetylmuramoyl-L-alanyl-D-glutamate--2,6-diaminopimelate ligase [Candidatus Omnitrophota bacterium]